MGLWGSIWQAAKETGEQALKSVDSALDSARTSMEQHESAHNQGMEDLLSQFMAGNPNLTADQKAQLRKFAFKTGKLPTMSDLEPPIPPAK
ncbi:MAG: hypothetical protein H7338_03065 [Candidatus Sericytochromatia bacterium]|nr:hypothetical protein [Candidatus Sericytochromatia bacterium]